MGSNSKAKRDSKRRSRRHDEQRTPMWLEVERTDFIEMRHVKWSARHLAAYDPATEPDRPAAAAAALLVEVLDEPLPGLVDDPAVVADWTFADVVGFARSLMAYGVDAAFAGRRAAVADA